MTRPIKFRAWDGKQKRMWEWDDIKGDSLLEIAEVYSERHEHLMQFTGLLDKNGKEIYEGDILAHLLYETGQEVRYDGGAFIIGKHPLEDLLGGVALGGEVIGNIYENKDLLV